MKDVVCFLMVYVFRCSFLSGPCFLLSPRIRTRLITFLYIYFILSTPFTQLGHLLEMLVGWREKTRIELVSGDGQTTTGHANYFLSRIGAEVTPEALQMSKGKIVFHDTLVDVAFCQMALLVFKAALAIDHNASVASSGNLTGADGADKQRSDARSRSALQYAASIRVSSAGNPVNAPVCCITGRDRRCLRVVSKNDSYLDSTWCCQKRADLPVQQNTTPVF